MAELNRFAARIGENVTTLAGMRCWTRFGLHGVALVAALLVVLPTATESWAAPPTEDDTPSTEAERVRPRAAPTVQPRPQHRGPAALRAEYPTDPRAALLERIRCEGEDASTCFMDESWSDFDHQSFERVGEAEIEQLLAEILAGLEAHDSERIRRAEAEMQAETAAEAGWFGADDHLMHPSTDIYDDPVAALSRPDLHLDLIDPADFDYPIVLNQRTQDWMVYFLTRGRRWYVRWLARSQRYAPLIVPRLREAGLPTDLLYQSMIESGFNPYATSTAAAVGIWQFIPSTGRAYGLDRDWWIDERRDPEQATGAAIELMSDLYRQFGSWELASSAYNAGSGKISRAIRQYETEDYWELSASHRTYLKAETKNYVPKIMAAAILAKYADRYGLTEEIKEDDILGAWVHDVVPVSEATDLRVAAGLLGLTLEELEGMNPALRRGYTPPGVENYPLNVPSGRGAAFAEAYSKLPEAKRTTFVRYTVRRGDTLGRIAKNYGVPVSTVMRMNNISDARKLRVGQKLLIPVRADALGGRDLVHVVVRGDTLSGIAEKYGMKVADLRSNNSLKDDTLAVGQRLEVRTAGAATPPPVAATTTASVSRSDAAESAASTSGGPTQTWHTVKGGDSLSRIATTHRTTISELRRLNGFGNRHVLHPGDKIRLRPDPPTDPTTTYTVKSGDTLSEIARRYGMTTPELMRINSLKDSDIRVGQKLKVVASGRGGSPVVHVVAAGDTLSTIAERYKTSVDSIQRGNGLTGTNIRVGQKLTVYPSGGGSGRAAERTIDYRVQSGDTLGGISRRYGVSVDELMAWNDLNGTTIRPGQKLRVILR